MKECNKVKKFFSQPAKAFDAEKKTDMGAAFKYMLLLSLIVSILTAIVSAIFPTGISLFGPGVDVVIIFVTTYITLIIFQIIWSVWLHVWTYVFGGRKGIVQTFKSVFYGTTPTYVLGWIPIINVIMMIWSVVLTGIGLTRLHGMTGGRAAGAIIVAIIIPVIIIGAIVGMAFLYIISGINAGT
ncbi:MAG: YIP1 family protein, partial [Nanoarchaeota archaeon]|nr:YIP1 family protein [Nanoarchaeota archaeon]